MYKRSNAQKWICLFLALVLSVCPLAGSATESPASDETQPADGSASDVTVTSLYSEIESLRIQQSSLDSEIAAQKEQTAGVWRQKELMDRQIALLASEIACYDRLLAYYDEQLAAEERRYADLTDSYDAHFAVLAARLRQSYEEGMPGLLELFSRSDSLLSLLVGMERRDEIEAYDRSLMESLEQEQIRLMEVQTSLETLRALHHQATIEQVERKQLLNAKLQESGSYLQSLESTLDRFSYYLQQSQAGIQMADRQIAETIAVLEEQIAQNGKDVLLAGKSDKEVLLADTLKADMESGRVQSGAEFFPGGSRYIWPLAISSDAPASVSLQMGYITYQAGGKIITDYHSGIDLAADYGSDVLAAASGKVVATGYEEGYGNFAVVYHEDGSHTRYAHLSEVVVETGDFVLQGEVIAKAGSSGNSTGVGCHFELFVDGVIANPEQYLILPAVPSVDTAE